jgi:CubicO group peptidase (beta-lactamase class C family)
MSKLAKSFLLVGCLSGPAISCADSPTDSAASFEWPVASAESQGLDPDILDTLTAHTWEGRFGRISSLLIVRHGYLVYEEYFRGQDSERLHPVYSVTKSVSSALIGAALARGEIDGLDARLLAFFPEYPSLENPSSAKGLITLRHVLQMKAGFQWDEWSTPYGSPNNPTTRLVASPDWIKFVLDLPLENPPGATFTYNSGGTMLLAGVLKRATGMSARAFAERVLFNPLGITDYTWETGPHDITNTGWGLSLRPRDMAKFGFLYLRNGAWNGRQVIRHDWIEQSMQPHVRFESGGGYGFQWWLLPLGPNGSEPLAPYAAGWGGQYIFVLPERDMVVVSTAEEYDGRSEMGTLLFDFIFAADREAASMPAPDAPASLDYVSLVSSNTDGPASSTESRACCERP